MRIKLLDERLSAVVSLINNGSGVADIGSDHGYLPLYLLKNGISEKVLVSDINSGPLSSARKNFERFGLSDKLISLQCDGIGDNIPSEYETIVIAGMGGLTECGIIERAKENLIINRNILILQPMKELEAVRKKIFEIGYKISAERRVKTDNNKIYTVIRAEFGNESKNYSDVELLLGRSTVCFDRDIYVEYLDKTLSKLEYINNKGGNVSTEFIDSIKKYRSEL